MSSVVGDGVAVRREVELGFAEGDLVEAVSGLADGERVVVVGNGNVAVVEFSQELTGATPRMICSDPSWLRGT